MCKILEILELYIHIENINHQYYKKLCKLLRKHFYRISAI